MAWLTRVAMGKDAPMATVSFQFLEDFFPHDLIAWYHQAQLHDIAVIALPDRMCSLRLVRGSRACVLWWPEGERSMTVTLENAVKRLTMLQNSRTQRQHAEV
jgi:hypothetical protein